MQTTDMDLKGVSGFPSVNGVLEEPQDLRRSLRVAKVTATIPKRVVSPYFAKKPAAGKILKRSLVVSKKKEAEGLGEEILTVFEFSPPELLYRAHELPPVMQMWATEFKDMFISKFFPVLFYLDPEQGSTGVEDEAVVVPSLPVDNYRLLAADFYACDALDLAPRLLGKLLRHEDVILQITEVEAYRTGDTACHARFGRTTRTEAMFRAGGHAYVFLCYGINVMLNVAADKAGVGAAVLIRACSPVAGLATILRRRKQSAVKPVLLTGPGKVGQALGLTTDWSCHPLFLPGGLEILDGPAPGAILAGPRVGIDYATPQDVAAPWRFAVAGTPWVSAPRATLLPIQWSPDTILSDVLTGM